MYIYKTKLNPNKKYDYTSFTFECKELSLHHCMSGKYNLLQGWGTSRNDKKDIKHCLQKILEQSLAFDQNNYHYRLARNEQYIEEDDVYESDDILYPTCIPTLHLQCFLDGDDIPRSISFCMPLDVFDWNRAKKDAEENDDDNKIDDESFDESLGSPYFGETYRISSPKSCTQRIMHQYIYKLLYIYITDAFIANQYLTENDREIFDRYFSVPPEFINFDEEEEDSDDDDRVTAESWVCSRCTFINCGEDAHSNTCTVCDHPKPAQSPTVVDDNENVNGDTLDIIDIESAVDSKTEKEIETKSEIKDDEWDEIFTDHLNPKSFPYNLRSRTYFNAEKTPMVPYSNTSSNVNSRLIIEWNHEMYKIMKKIAHHLKYDESYVQYLKWRKSKENCATTLHGCLDNYFRDTNRKIVQLPKVLVIHLQRFFTWKNIGAKYTLQSMSEFNVHFTLDERLDLERYMSDDDGGESGVLYELRGLTLCKFMNRRNQHYWNLIHNESDSNVDKHGWYIYEDSNVQRVENGFNIEKWYQVGQQAVLLFYYKT